MSKVTAHRQEQVHDDLFDPQANVKVKVQKLKQHHPASTSNQGGSNSVNIPLEIELSDALLHKLLKSSVNKRDQLGSIHRVAKQRLLGHLTSQDDRCELCSDEEGGVPISSPPSYIPRPKHSKHPQEVLDKIDSLLKAVHKTPEPSTVNRRSQTQPSFPLIDSVHTPSLPVVRKSKVKSRGRPTTIHESAPARKKGNVIEISAADSTLVDMYSYKARYVKNRDHLIKNGSVKDNLWGTDVDYYSPRRYDDSIDYSRFESSNNNDLDESFDVPLPQSQPKLSKRGKLVMFYKSGDKHYKGLNITVNQKQFPRIEALLDFLSSKLPTTTGLKTVFSWPNGKQIYEIKDFLIGQVYVCSDTMRLNRSIDYGEIKPTVWHNKKMSAVKFRRDENELLQYTRDPQPALGTNAKPRVLTIISNVDRSSKEKVMLNPQTNQTFEEILHDIGNMVTIDNPPVTGLFTERKPHKKVFSFSQLFKDFKDHENFLAVGRELVPVDNRRKVPKSTQSDTALTFKPAAKKVVSKKNATKRFQRPKDYDSDSDDIPPRTNLSVPAGQPSLFSRMGPAAPRRFPRPPLSPKQNGVTNNLIKKPLKDYHTIRIDVHNQRRGSLGTGREFYTPSNYQRSDGKRPDKKLQLEWVYGYRGRDARNNLYVLPSGEILYYVASVAVLYDRKKDRQRHYVGHNEDITSMVLHPNQFCVASGQASGTNRQETAAHIRIWDARSLVTYAILGFGVFQVAVGSLAFSVESDGQYLLAIDESDKHILSVWSWQEEQVVVKTALVNDPDFRLFGTNSDTVVWGAFHPLDDRIIVTYGKQHIYFWKLFYDGSSSTRLLRDKLSGIFQGDVPKFITSVCFTPDGDVLSGDSSGNITLWAQDTSGAFTVSRRPTANLRQAHRKSVFCLHMFSDGTFISGGGHEIKKWDSQYKCKDSKKLAEQYGFVRTLIPMREDSVDYGLYVGTTKNCLLDGNWDEKFRTVVVLFKLLRSTKIISQVGHSEELWALSNHPQEHTFVTAGYDHSVCKWSAVSHKLIWKTVVEKPCLSVCHNASGDLLVIGTSEGRFMVLDAVDGSHVATIQVGNGAVDSTKFSPAKKKVARRRSDIACVAMSPDGRLLAMGAQDGNIYIYSLADSGQFFRKYKEGSLKGHKNFVMQIDWSEDSEYIQSVSGDYDLMFWNIYEMRREQDPSVIRDISWSTQSCVLGYSTAGPWTHLEEEDEDINIVCKSNYEDYLAVGDNQGALRLFKYPASAAKPDFYERKAYSSHVTNVKFLFDDSYLLSTGGIDAGLMQWALVDPKTPR